ACVQHQGRSTAWPMGVVLRDSRGHTPEGARTKRRIGNSNSIFALRARPQNPYRRALTTDDGIITPNVLLAQALVAQLTSPCRPLPTSPSHNAPPPIPTSRSLTPCLAPGRSLPRVSSWPLAHNGP